MILAIIIAVIVALVLSGVGFIALMRSLSLRGVKMYDR